MKSSRVRGRLGIGLAALLALGAVVLVVSAGAASPARAGATASAPGYDTNEFGPDPGKDVNRAIPKTKSKSNAPRVVPGHASNVVSSNPGLTGFAGLTLKDQRTADGGNQFSLEPPDQGLCVGGQR